MTGKLSMTVFPEMRSEKLSDVLGEVSRGGGGFCLFASMTSIHSDVAKHSDAVSTHERTKQPRSFSAGASCGAAATAAVAAEAALAKHLPGPCGWRTGSSENSTYEKSKSLSSLQATFDRVILVYHRLQRFALSRWHPK